MRDKGKPDEWTRKAKAAGFAARSVFKLEEIARREPGILPKKGRVLDLGCCPGSWSQYLLQKRGRNVHLVGLDISDVPNYPGAAFIQDTILSVGREALLEVGGSLCPLFYRTGAWWGWRRDRGALWRPIGTAACQRGGGGGRGDSDT